MIVDFPVPDPQQTLLGARLRRWRTERGVEIEAMAGIVDLTPGELRLVEAGHARLDSARIAAATQALHLPLWALTSDVPAC